VGGATRLTHNERDNMQPVYLDVTLYEYHGEYLSVLHNPTYRPGFARSFMAVDLSHASDIGLAVDTTDLPAHIREAISVYGNGNGEYLGGYIFLVSGEAAGHKALFTELWQEVMDGPQGGDDDVFDYWPGAVDCVFMYAKLLWDLLGDTYYKERMVELANAKGNDVVMEWDGAYILKWAAPEQVSSE
jgi:hypothetical protein